MTNRPSGLLSRCFHMLTARMLLEQVGLGLLVFALFTLWLRIPDASAMDVVGSVLLGLVVLAVAGMGESSLMLQLCNRARTRRRLILGALVLLVAAMLWWGWNALIAHVEVKDGLRAGYLNSKVSHSMRNVFSYGHLMRWFRWIAEVSRWVGGGVLAVGAFAWVTTTKPRRAVGRGLRSGLYWVTLVPGAIAVSAVTTMLMRRTASHGLGVEMLSLLVRLGLVILMNGLLVSALLVILAGTMCEVDYATSRGTLDESQPRTAGRP